MTFSPKSPLAGPVLASALALALALGGASGASAQSEPTSPEPPILENLRYAIVAATAVQFAGGGMEHGFLLGLGYIMGTGGIGSMPNLSYGAEVDTINMTGPGAGWGIDRVRAAVHSEQGKVRVSAMGGLARTRAPGGFSELGYSFGLRISTTNSVSNTGTVEFIGADGQPRPVLFIQADLNDTGTYRTTDLAFGFEMKF